jgi:hypothetical protein
MLPFHERLARIGLEALESYGFVLAGGYAISTNGIGDRPSADVDLFTNVYEPSLFEVSVAKLRAAFLDAGMSVHDNLIGQTFADFSVTDDATQETSSIQIGVNYREFTPATGCWPSETGKKRCRSTGRCWLTDSVLCRPRVRSPSRSTRSATAGAARSSTASSTGPTRSTPPSSAEPSGSEPAA